jgi:hypothetical protein
MFQLQRGGHYSKDCPKSKTGVGSSKVLALKATLAQPECNRLIFMKGKIAKREILCLLDTWAFHNFIIRESAKRMELHLEKLKAPIEVHFADGVPHPTTLQAKGVPLQLAHWRGNDALLSPGVNPLEGSPNVKLRKLGPKGTFPASNSRKG